MKKFTLDIRNISIFCCLLTSTLIAFYLHIKSSQIASCGAGSSCDQVTTSSYANVLGYPITLLGCITYISLTICLLFYKRAPLLKFFGYYLSISIILGAAWFFIVQLLIIDAFCYYCCAIHFFAVIASILFLSPQTIPTRLKKSIVTAGLITVILMSLLQVYNPHTLKKTLISDITPLSLNTDNVLSLYNDEIKIDLNELPSFTPNGREKVSLLLSDFTCPHCLSLTNTLLTNNDNINAQTSIYFLPVFQDPSTKEINRIMLLLQRIDPDLFTSTVSEIYEQTIPLSYNEIKAHIENNTGGQFKTYYDGYYKWSDKLLSTGTKLAELNQINAKVSGFPQFMIADKIIEGEIGINSINTLAATMSEVHLTAAVAEKNNTLNSKTSNLSIFPAETHLGKIIKNQSKHNSFKLINRSNRTIEFDKWSVSCGCIQLKNKPTIIPANSEIEVEYEFDTKKFIGNVTHRVFIYEKNIDKPHSVAIRAHVWMPVKILPFKTNFGNISTGGTSEPQHTTILNNTLKPVYITLGNYNQDILNVRLKEVLAGQHYELISQIINAPAEPMESVINIQTSNKDCSFIDLPIISKNSELITIHPKLITSSEVDQKGSTMVEITCNNYSLRLKKQFKDIKYIGTQKNMVKFSLQGRANTHTKFLFEVKFDKSFDFKKANLENDYFEVTFKNTNLKTLQIYISEK